MALAGRDPGTPLLETATAMADRMKYRGPDSFGSWQTDRKDIAFGHRRLAIVDLTEAGHQPMSSSSGRWTLSYNGELYNTEDLRRRLDSPPNGWRGHSDSEVLIEAIAQLGVDATLERAVGMFAFAAYDRDRDELWIARDRFGEKPLYYASTPSTFIFASELGGIRAAPGCPTRIDRDSVVELLERSAIAAPFTIYESVFKLMPGSRARVRRDGSIEHHRYYDPSLTALAATPIDRSDDETIEAFEQLMADTVASRMVSDVPLGAFLSGGVDSSLIVAMMQQTSTHTVQTFTIGFETEELNEAPAARVVADRLGTDHHEWIVTGADALAVVPELGSLYDEPFADSSQIPTTLVSRFARQTVTVALSGDGGDELFGGYERYQLLARADRFRGAPAPLRRSAAGALRLLSEDTLDRFGASPLGKLLPGPFRKRTGKRVHTAAELLAAADNLALYDLIVRPHRLGPLIVPGGERRARPTEAERLGRLDPIELGMASDTVDYLPNDILTKVDRASMSASLETRAPMLDPHLHEFAWSLRSDQRVRNGHGKWLVREAARRHVPEIAGLPKRGFGVPLAEWLRGPLRSWGEDILSAQSLSDAGVLSIDSVRQLWHEHQTGKHDRAAELWPALMFGAWAELQT